MKNIKIANAQGFWGDRPLAAQTLMEQVTALDYLSFDYLAEVSLSIMAIQREKDPNLGYAKDFLQVITSLIDGWKTGHKVKVISNAGGLNPLACAQGVRDLLLKAGLDKKVSVVYGDDVLPLLQTQQAGFYCFDDEPSVYGTDKEWVSANAYLGAFPIAQALDGGADIVITGRVADPSLTVGACIHHFKWTKTQLNELAGATVAGHLIECGSQACGGNSSHWLEIPSPETLAFPIVEIDPKGDCVVMKSAQAGGLVNERTIKEQLLYEIQDPDHYMSPDVEVSFLSLKVTDLGSNKVSISGAVGRPCSSYYKVSATYKAGYRCEGTLVFFGKEVRIKAQKCGEVILKRVALQGYTLDKTCIEILGQGDCVKGVFASQETYEVVLRVAALSQDKEALQCFSREVAPMITSGPQGVTGYATGRPKLRPVFGFWPCLIEKEKLTEKVKEVVCENSSS